MSTNNSYITACCESLQAKALHEKKARKNRESVQYALLQKLSVESDGSMADVELLEQHSKFSEEGPGEEVLIW